MTSRKKRRKSSGLSDHHRHKSTLTPPLLNLDPPLQDIQWERDVLPDMLWISAVIEHLGEQLGIAAVTEVLDRLDRFIPAADEAAISVLTGSMTSFDLIPDGSRGDALSALRQDGLYQDAFPWDLVRALQKYSDVPGSWVLDGWKGDFQIVPEDQPTRFLSRVVEASRNGHSRRSTMVKALWIRGYQRAGKIVVPENLGTIQLLSRYPFGLDDDELAEAEGFLRATFSALSSVSLNPQSAEAQAWAKRFWRQNWRLYPCRPVSTAAPAGAGHPTSESDDAAWMAVHQEWAHQLDAIEEHFLDTCTSSDPDLYNPDRHEVLTGLVYRAVRATRMLVQSPGQWNLEHGAGTIRSLVETRIIHRWLVARPDMSTRFKEYGRGHQKLQLLHLREFRDTLGDDEGAYLDQPIEQLEAYVNSDTWEELQEIRLNGNFAGIDIRKMAEQVDLMQDYRLIFAPASTSVHGEWGALDQFVLTPCLNPLHRWHRIPDPQFRAGLTPGLVDIAIHQTQLIVEDYAQAMANRQASN